MSSQAFKKRIDKQTWFLNHREKEALNQYINQRSVETIQQEHATPSKFVASYLKYELFNQPKYRHVHAVTNILGLLIMNIVLLTLFLTGLILSITTMNGFLRGNQVLSSTQLFLFMILAIVAMVIAIYFIPKSNRYFTKRIIASQFNRKQ